MELAKEFEEAGIRVGVDLSANTVGKKIRAAEKMKVPYSLVIGDKEKDSGKLNVRKKGDEDTKEMDKDKFIKKVLKEIKDRSL